MPMVAAARPSDVIEDLINLSRINIFAPNDHVALAIDNVKEAIPSR